MLSATLGSCENGGIMSSPERAGASFARLLLFASYSICWAAGGFKFVNYVDR